MKICLPVSPTYPILYIIWFVEMKVHSYARNMNLNYRKCGKKQAETQNSDFLKKQNGDFFSYHKCFIALWAI